ncbi:hypothetical protein GCM10010222_32880 [Streptomyces tanashiensis]|uniref:hypothetical protein n=1 Tax=Streptomyces tanashiensis TaxID=67367 RepID=UPI0016783FF5|nr:hypothetical protein [Streptomyces tanashiensis]GGS88795.1 hypothetical protein GCM10010222_32880 [Streptomyces tanashiensis]
MVLQTLLFLAERVVPPSTLSLSVTAAVSKSDFWRFHVDRDQRDELVLFFFVGDPDIGNTYVMRREAASGPEAP